MGKRFGRNQKRRMREKIKELEDVYNRECNLLKHCSTEKERYKSMWKQLIGEIKTWWENSVLLDPKIKKIHSNELPPQYRIPLHKQISSFNKYATVDAEFEIHYQTLDACRIASFNDLGKRHIHIYLQVGDKKIGYYIDPTAFMTFKGMPNAMFSEVCEGIKYEFDRNFQ